MSSPSGGKGRRTVFIWYVSVRFHIFICVRVCCYDDHPPYFIYLVRVCTVPYIYLYVSVRYHHLVCHLVGVCEKETKISDVRTHYVHIYDHHISRIKSYGTRNNSLIKRKITKPTSSYYYKLLHTITSTMNSTDPAERMIIHLTGKRSHELPKRNRSLKFPVKVCMSSCRVY